LGSRWQEFFAGSVGAPNPAYTALRTDAGLLQTALLRMHVGARGGQMLLEHFKNLIDAGKQSPENMLSALQEIEDYATSLEEKGRKASGADQTTPVSKFKVIRVE
jgi:hypothetical protein